MNACRETRRLFTFLGGTLMSLIATGCCDGCDDLEQRARGDQQASRTVWSSRVRDATHRGVVLARVTPDKEVVVAATLHGDVKIGDSRLEARRAGSADKAKSADGDVVVWRIGAEGETKWAQRFGDGRDQSVASMAVTRKGTVFVGGRFEGSMVWGSHEWKVKDGAHGAFVGTLDPSGAPGWGTWFDAEAGGDPPTGGTETPSFGATLRSVGTDALGRLFVLGSYVGKFRVDGKVPIEDRPDRVGGVFFARFDQGGAMRWFRLASHSETATGGESSKGSGPLRVHADVMATTEHGNLVIFGTAQGKGDFVGVPMQADPGGSAFLSVWNQSGEHLWTELFPASGELWHPRVAVTTEGTIYVAAVTRGKVTVGETSVQAGSGKGESGVGNPFGELFVGRFEPSGKPVWLRRIATVAWAPPVGLSVDSSRGVIVSATMAMSDGCCDLGGGPLFSEALKGAHDVVFAAAYDSDGRHRWSRGFATEGWSRSEDVAYGPEGRTVVAGTFGIGQCETACDQAELGDVVVSVLGM